MKKDIHPAYNEINVSCSCGNKMVVNSTLTEDKSVDTCYACHPQYTGKKREIKAGRVEQFRSKYQTTLTTKKKAAANEATEKDN